MLKPETTGPPSVWLVSRAGDDPAGTCERSSEELTDAEIVRQAKQDRQHFGPLYDRYADPVFRFCYRRLGNREAAEHADVLTFEETHVHNTGRVAVLVRYNDTFARLVVFSEQDGRWLIDETVQVGPLPEGRG